MVHFFHKSVELLELFQVTTYNPASLLFAYLCCSKVTLMAEGAESSDQAKKSRCEKSGIMEIVFAMIPGL